MISRVSPYWPLRAGHLRLLSVGGLSARNGSRVCVAHALPRILAAQAQIEGLTFVSKGRALRQFGMKRLS